MLVQYLVQTLLKLNEKQRNGSCFHKNGEKPLHTRNSITVTCTQIIVTLISGRISIVKSPFNMKTECFIRQVNLFFPFWYIIWLTLTCCKEIVCNLKKQGCLCIQIIVLALYCKLQQAVCKVDCQYFLWKQLSFLYFSVNFIPVCTKYC